MFSPVSGLLAFAIILFAQLMQGCQHFWMTKGQIFQNTKFTGKCSIFSKIKSMKMNKLSNLSTFFPYMSLYLKDKNLPSVLFLVTPSSSHDMTYELKTLSMIVPTMIFNIVNKLDSLLKAFLF